MRPRIGVMAVGLGSYWAQFPGMREELLGHHHALLTKFDPERCELVRAEMVDSAASAREAGARFRAEGVEAVFCQIATYANSETLAPAIRELDVPVVLLNVQSVRALDVPNVRTIADWLGKGITCAALPEMTAVLRRMGKRFDIVTGFLDGDAYVDRQIDVWTRLLTIRRRLRTESLGLFGHPFSGMMDLNLDETAFFRQFGTYIHPLEWHAIADAGDAVTPAERAVLIEEVRSVFAIPDDFPREDLESIATVLGGLTRIVESHRLLGLASHFEGRPDGRQNEVLAALNPALSVLNGRGIACPVEADMKSAIAMHLLRGLAGSATLAELYSMDFDQDVCIIGHSGAGDPAISGPRPTLRVSEVFHGKSGRGYVTQFYPVPGPVTLLSVTQGAQGEYRLVAAEGECVEGPALALGDTNCRVRFPCGLRDFIDRWSAFGPTHHGVLGYGHHVESLKRAAVALDMPLDIVR
ncbi:MAG: sugar isomerase [Fimbriimonas sp.]